MGAVLDTQRTQEIIAGMRIPEQPQVLIDLRRELAGEAPDIGRIAETIEQDMGMAAMVLRTVNSPFFGCLTEVSSLRHATVMLGLKNIANVVSGLALRREFESSGERQPPNFWDSPGNVASLSAYVAKHVGGVSPDEAYMLGLFRDCGEVLLGQRFSDYAETVAQARRTLTDGCRFTAIEDERYDTNHAVVSYLISRSWKLPASVTAVILEHHQACTRFAIGAGERSPEMTLLAILKLAEYIDERFREGSENREWCVLREHVGDYFAMSGPDMDDLEANLVDMLDCGTREVQSALSAS